MPNAGRWIQTGCSKWIYCTWTSEHQSVGLFFQKWCRWSVQMYFGCKLKEISQTVKLILQSISALSRTKSTFGSFETLIQISQSTHSMAWRKKKWVFYTLVWKLKGNFDHNSCGKVPGWLHAQIPIIKQSWKLKMTI